MFILCFVGNSMAQDSSDNNNYNNFEDFDNNLALPSTSTGMFYITFMEHES